MGGAKDSMNRLTCWAVATAIVLATGCSDSHREMDATVGEDAGTSADDAGPAPEPCETPGAVETVACGMCGTTERFCSADLEWAYGLCEAEGECAPGTMDAANCGLCGSQTRRCTTACAWETVGSCTDEGVCEPGTAMQTSDGCPAGQVRSRICGSECTYDPFAACEADTCAPPGSMETVACGMCGSLDRFCTAEGVWSSGACEGEGACVPGSMGMASCGMCGMQEALCDTTCSWVPSAVCTGEGVCSPGARMSTMSGCPAGQTRTLECDAMCDFTIVAQPCTARCSVPSDCTSGVCTGGACQPATCADGVQNSDETDVDCGGATSCPRCATGFRCGSTSDCATDTCTSGFCGAVPCNTSPARVLVYGPGGSMATGSGWFPPGTITTIATDSTWRSLATSDFGQYDVIWIAGGLCTGTTDSVMGTAEDTLGAWGPAVRGRIVITTEDADFHGGSEAMRFTSNVVSWLNSPGRNAAGGRTSLYMSWGCTMIGSRYVAGARGTPERFVSVLGSPLTGSGQDYCTNVMVTATGSTHPVMGGIPPFWGCPFHGGFGDVPSTYDVLVRGSVAAAEATAVARESPVRCVP